MFEHANGGYGQGERLVSVAAPAEPSDCTHVYPRTTGPTVHLPNRTADRTPYLSLERERFSKGRDEARGRKKNMRVCLFLRKWWLSSWFPFKTHKEATNSRMPLHEIVHLLFTVDSFSRCLHLLLSTCLSLYPPCIMDKSSVSGVVLLDLF